MLFSQMQQRNKYLKSKDIWCWLQFLCVSPGKINSIEEYNSVLNSLEPISHSSLNYPVLFLPSSNPSTWWNYRKLHFVETEKAHDSEFCFSAIIACPVSNKRLEQAVF